MAYRIHDNSDMIRSEVDNKKTLALRFIAEAIHRESRPNTPMKSGQLRGDVVKRVSGSKGMIRWGKKYAWYQERGYTSGKVRRYTTPGTNAHFAENAVKKVAKNSRKYFRQAGL